MSAFTEWEAGELEDIPALRSLCSDLGEVQSEIDPLEAQQQTLRSQISRVLDHYGQNVTLPGFGKLEITAPSITHGYDKKALDELIIQLTSDGYGPIAQQIALCRTSSSRAGTLRITREKAKK